MADESLIEDSMPRLKELCEQIPKNIDFGFCAVGQETDRTFKLTNYTTTEKNFSFAECPFKIDPIQDSIAPKSSKTIRMSYYPTNATVVVASTVFRVDSEEERVIKLSAIGKFPFLKTQNTKIDFQDVIYGKRKVKDLIIYNASEVTTYFNITPTSLDEYSDRSFSLDVDHGYIPPKSSFLVKITYRPMIWDLYSCTHFSINCQGGNTIEIQCVGKALSIEAKLSSRIVDFGSIRLNSTTNRMVTLHNNSDTNCSFEIIIDNTGIFSVKESVGVIKPKSYARLLVLFTPQKTINYYQRVYVLIRNHLALYMDLLGNCYDLLIKPPPLSPLVVKEARKTLGLGANASYAYALNQGDIDDPTNQDLETTKHLTAQSTLTHKELFGSICLSDSFLKVSLKYLDFSYASVSGVLPSREITLENISGRKLSVFWTNDAPYRGTKDNVFSVYPPTANMQPGETSKFTITFRPSNLGAFFFQKLQCFAIDYDTNMMEKISKASFKMKKRMIGVSNLSSTQVQGELNAPRMMPPIELEIICTGNSFGPDTQPFIPMIQVVPKNELVFSPCAVGDTVYCSMQLVNKTDTPSYFKFDNDGSEIFQVFPKFGLIEGHKFKIIFFKFSPKVPSLQNHTMHCRLNNAIDVIRVKLAGYCCQPMLEIDNISQIFFPPSFIGVHSKQKIGFHNRSRVPLSFFINVPKKYRDELMFGPLRSVLLPNQTDYITCSLMPLKKAKYHIKVPIEVHGENADQTAENQQLEVYGEGGDGSLVAKPEDVDFGIIKVNFYKMQKITIYNHSHVTFYLNLELKPQDDTVKMDEASRRAIAESFHLDFVDGIITGHSKIEVSITFKPTEVCDLNVRLVCMAKEKPPLGVMTTIDPAIINEKCTINLRAKGSFPILKVVDIRNDDLSVATLWDSFRLDNINNDLLDKTYPGKPEVKDFEDLVSTMESDDIIEKNYYEWNFGYLQNKKIIEPRKIILTVQNVGGTDLDWKFKFPNDNQVDISNPDKC